MQTAFFSMIGTVLVCLVLSVLDEIYQARRRK